jgi:hypothetical protein
MKTIKFILLIFVLICSTMLMATEYKLHQASSATFKSVSMGGAGHMLHNSSWNNRTIISSDGSARVNNPVTEFQSTSAMYSSGSVLPLAAVSGVTTTNDLINPSSKPRGPRRIIDEDDQEDKPNNWEDPNKTPIGNALLPLLLLVVGYIIYIPHRKSTPETTKQ